MKIGKTHFYCGFCNQLFEKERLKKHELYEMKMIDLSHEAFSKELLKNAMSQNRGGIYAKSTNR